ncbi:S24 family peptidase [Flammeovirga sp. OC4]|uniref:S24 family peptidase n=1 Tax=Flammeovirga sp. OC4 TaxID=1382345 RepID=UPI0005C56740|nr:S24 family peptidase [Flammeovirga sp. OC4]
MLNRLKTFLDSRNISIKEIEKLIGASNGVISRALKNGSDIQTKWVRRILDLFPELNANWLLLGSGEMILNKVDFRKPDLRMEFEAPVYKKNSHDLATIPLVGTETIAGFGENNFEITKDDVIKEFEIPEFTGVNFMIRVKGDSMLPKYSSGDIVGAKIIKDSNFLQWGNPYIIATREHGVIIKRLFPSEKDNSLRAVSENEKYPPYDIPKNEITGIASVIGVIRLE